MCRRGVFSKDMDTILGCGGFDWFLFSINCTECARSSFAESPIGPAQCVRAADKCVVSGYIVLFPRFRVLELLLIGL